MMGAGNYYMGIKKIHCDHKQIYHNEMKKEEHRRVTIEPDWKRGQKFRKFQKKISYLNENRVKGQKDVEMLVAFLTVLWI